MRAQTSTPLLRSDIYGQYSFDSKNFNIQQYKPKFYVSKAQQDSNEQLMKCKVREPPNSREFRKTIPINMVQDRERLYEELNKTKQQVNSLSHENYQLRVQIKSLEVIVQKTLPAQVKKQEEAKVESIESYWNSSLVAVPPKQKKQLGEVAQFSAIGQLKKQIQELRDELEDTREVMLKMKRSAKLTRIQEMEADLKNFKDETVRLKGMLHQQLLRGGNASMSEEILEEKYLEQVQLGERFREENAELMRRVKKSQEEIQKFQEEYQELENNYQRNVKEKTQLKKQLNDLEEQFNKAQLNDPLFRRGQDVTQIKLELEKKVVENNQYKNENMIKDRKLHELEKMLKETTNTFQDKLNFVTKEKENYKEKAEKQKIELIELQDKYQQLFFNTNRNLIKQQNVNTVNSQEDLRRNSQNSIQLDQKIVQQTPQKVEPPKFNKRKLQRKLSAIRQDDIEDISIQIRYKLRMQNIRLPEIELYLFEGRESTSTTLGELIGIFQKKPFELNQNESVMVARYLIEPYGEKEITYNFNLSRDNDSILSQLTKAIGKYNILVGEDKIQMHESIRTKLYEKKDDIMGFLKPKPIKGQQTDDSYPSNLCPRSTFCAALLQTQLTEEEQDIVLQTLYEQTQEFNLIDLDVLWNTWPRDGHIKLMRSQQEMNLKAGELPKIVQECLNNLLNYADDNNLSILDLRKQMDQDGSGHIERGELKAFLKKCEIDIEETELMHVIDHFDIEGDGRISMADVGRVLQNANQQRKLAQNQTIPQKKTGKQILSLVAKHFLDYMTIHKMDLFQIFMTIDQDGQGSISRDEFKQMLRNRIIIPLDQDEYSDFFKMVDNSDDGQIHFNEFQLHMIPEIEKLINKPYHEKKQSISLLSRPSIDLTVELQHSTISEKVIDICKKPLSSRTVIETQMLVSNLKNIKFFKEQFDEHYEGMLEEVATNARLQYYTPNELIVKQDTFGDTFYIIVKGQCKVLKKVRTVIGTYETKKGKIREKHHEQVKEIMTLNDGDYFGEYALIEKKPRGADVVTVTDCYCLSLDKDSFERIMATKTKRKFLHLLDTLSHNSILREISKNTVKALFMIMERKVFNFGDVIYKQGQKGGSLYFVIEGEFKMYSTVNYQFQIDTDEYMNKVKEQEICVIGLNETMGLEEFLTEEPRKWKAVCTSQVGVVYKLDRIDYKRIENRYPDIVEAIQQIRDQKKEYYDEWKRSHLYTNEVNEEVEESTVRKKFDFESYSKDKKQLKQIIMEDQEMGFISRDQVTINDDQEIMLKYSRFCQLGAKPATPFQVNTIEQIQSGRIKSAGYRPVLSKSVPEEFIITQQSSAGKKLTIGIETQPTQLYLQTTQTPMDDQRLLSLNTPKQRISSRVTSPQKRARRYNDIIQQKMQNFMQLSPDKINEMAIQQRLIKEEYKEKKLYIKQYPQRSMNQMLTRIQSAVRINTNQSVKQTKKPIKHSKSTKSMVPCMHIQLVDGERIHGNNNNKKQNFIIDTSQIPLKYQCELLQTNCISYCNIYEIIKIIKQIFIMNNEGQLRTLGDYQYDSKYCVGEGAFGKVYRGVKRSTNQEVAIKKLDASMINKDPYLRDSLEAEIQILRKLHHPNIVQFIDKFSTDRSIYIVTEFCADGDLRSLMKGQQIDESQILEIFCQLTSGFKELVKESIIHRDLKPANILNHKGTVKIADFGFAKFVDNFSQQLLRTCVGSPLYMSPQILKRLPYTTKSDIWSLGVIYYEMLFNKPPWNGFDEKSLVNSIMNKPLDIPKSKKLTSLSLNFLQGALVKEETGRMDWTQVFELFDSLKKQQKITGTVYFKDARPSVIQYNQGEDIQKSLQSLNQVRQQLGLNHFVNVELIQNIYLINSYYHKELQFEILSLLSTKLTCLQYQVLYQKCKQLLDKNKISEYQKYLNVLKGELDVANEFLQDTLQYFDRMGLLQNIKSQQDYQYIQRDIEYCEQLENIVKNKSQGIVKHILNENGTELPYELLMLLDYMLDVRIVYNRILKNQQVDFSLVHDKTRYKQKLSIYIHDLGFKLNEAFNY